MLSAIRSSGDTEVKWFGTQAVSHTLPPCCVRLVAWTGSKANPSLKNPDVGGWVAAWWANQVAVLQAASHNRVRAGQTSEWRPVRVGFAHTHALTVAAAMPSLPLGPSR